MFWKEVNRTRKGIEVKEECVKDVNGNVVTEKNELCKRQKGYFEGLLNVSERERAEITAKPGMKVRMFENVDVSTDEVQKSVECRQTESG